MDVGRAIGYIFEDPDWLKKAAIGSLLFFVPIFGWLVITGYWMRLIRRVYDGQELPLPEWDDFGGDFMLGLKAFIGMLVWISPVLILPFCLLCAFLPFMLINSSENDVAGALLAVLGTLGIIGFYVLIFIAQIMLLIMQPIVLGRIAVSGDIGSAFAFGEIIREIRRLPGPLLIVVLVQYGLSTAAGFGIVLCVVGILFTTFVSYLMLAHLYGQLRRLAGDLPPSRSTGAVVEPVS